MNRIEANLLLSYCALCYAAFYFVYFVTEFIGLRPIITVGEARGKGKGLANGRGSLKELGGGGKIAGKKLNY